MATSFIYRFGDFRLDPQARELRRDDALIALPASAFDCLVYLVEHRERAVGRDELIAAVWGRVDVSEKLLGQTIVRVRRAFGDSGNDQHAVRTVARYGYRWVAETGVEDAHGATAAAESASVQAPPDPPDAQSTPAGRRRWPLPAAIAAAVLALLTIAAVFRPERGVVDAPTAADATEAAGPAGAPPVQAGAAMVVPAQVEAPDDWAWLRLGLMDLVATRLRRGGLPTADSESVVRLLKQQEQAGERGHAPASSGTLLIRPQVRFDHGDWKISLEATGQDELLVEASGPDVLIAARRAADALLIRLGHTPPVADGEATAAALEELIHRVEAAVLADQLALAEGLLERAPPAFRDAPEIALQRARIQMRSGRYDEAERSLLALLERDPEAAAPLLRARMLIVLAAIYARRNQPDQAGDAYSRVIALLDGRNEPGALGYAYMGRGLVAVMKDRFEQGIADLGLARIEMEAAGDGYGATLIDLNAGLTEMSRHRAALALAKLEIAEQRFQRFGAREDLAYTRARMADLASRLLLHEEALAISDRQWPADTASGNERLRWRLVLVRARSLAGVGRIGEAQALVERLRAEADPAQDAVVRAEAEALAADLALQAADDEAAAALAQAAMTPELKSFDSYVYGRAAYVRIRALQRLGRLDEAASEVGSLRVWAEAGNDGGWRLIYALLAEAEQAWRERRRESALTLFEQAVAQAQQAGSPDDLVAATLPYLSALIASGRLQQAGEASGRVAIWADQDVRVAWAQAALYRAMGKTAAWRQATERAAQLAGERTAPEAAIAGDSVARSESPSP